MKKRATMKLFSPGKIGNLSLKNRISFAPMGVGALYNQTGGLTYRGIEYFVERAKGGAGMIRMGHTRSSRKFEHIPGPITKHAYADDKIQVSWMSELAERVHDYGAKMSLQLTAGVGRIAGYVLQTEGKAIAPSEISCFWYPHLTTKSLNVEEIRELVNTFETSAGLIKMAGLDAIELNAHEGYLIDQFLTKAWNKRTDMYGGCLENRFRFLKEIVEAIQRGAGKDFPIIVRFGLTHFLDEGRSCSEGLKIARLLEISGVGAVEIDAGCYENWYYPHPPTTQPDGLFVDYASQVKKVLNIPVIAVGKLGNPVLAEKVLQDGMADFIALARPLLSDPQWPNKVKKGLVKDIRPCVGCHEGCLKRIFEHKYISCAVNPSTGIEREMGIKKTDKIKRILTIGGGVGGMEAARVSALRGHDVTLWEKDAQLGGNFKPDEVPDFKNEYKLLVDYYMNQLDKLDIDVVLNKSASIESIKEFNPDVVFLAVGATPTLPEIKGLDKVTNKLFPNEVFTQENRIGESVVVIGGGLVGCEVALYLAKKNKEVTILEISDSILRDMFLVNKMHFKKLLEEEKITILTKVKVQEIVKERINIIHNNTELTIRFNYIIVATGFSADRKLIEESNNQNYDIYDIGDCIKPGKVKDAIWSAYRTARLV